MTKREKMIELMKAYDDCAYSIAGMFGTTPESQKVYDEMWSYARENGFVNSNGVIDVNMNTDVEIEKLWEQIDKASTWEEVAPQIERLAFLAGMQQEWENVNGDDLEVVLMEICENLNLPSFI